MEEYSSKKVRQAVCHANVAWHSDEPAENKLIDFADFNI